MGRTCARVASADCGSSASGCRCRRKQTRFVRLRFRFFRASWGHDGRLNRVFHVSSDGCSRLRGRYLQVAQKLEASDTVQNLTTRIRALGKKPRLYPPRLSYNDPQHALDLHRNFASNLFWEERTPQSQTQPQAPLLKAPSCDPHS